MPADANCIFCKIIAGDIPSFTLLDDARTFAFMDINPASEGHALVIPKFHSATLMETPDDWLAATISTARRVAAAIDKTMAPAGINLLQANGPGAAQSVLHFHMHVLPRTVGDGLKINWGLKPGDMGAIGALAERIRANLDEGKSR